jgi:hypothetical protein
MDLSKFLVGLLVAIFANLTNDLSTLKANSIHRFNLRNIFFCQNLQYLYLGNADSLSLKKGYLNQIDALKRPSDVSPHCFSSY